MKDVFLALDVGTGGARVTAYDPAGVPLAGAGSPYPTFHDHPGWAEQEPGDWWRASKDALRETAVRLGRHRVRAIGLTGQSPTIAPFDGSGRALRRALLYQDNRAVREAVEWSERAGGPEAVHRCTGHDPAAFHIGPKVLWLARHEPAIFTQANVWLQPRDLVAWRISGECATDWSHAGSTLLFDITTRQWSKDLFELFGLPPGSFPPALRPWTVLGGVRPQIASETGIPAGTPVVLGGADSQCCALGAGVLAPSELSDMAGSSTCLNAPVEAPLGDIRVANYCHVVPGFWCTELGLNASGLCLDWLVRLPADFGKPTFEQMGEAALGSPAGAKGLIFLPYMADGERFDPALRAGFCDLSLRHELKDMVRAVLEGVAFAIREHLETMDSGGCAIRRMRVSGGGSRLPLWNQIKADVAGIPVLSVESDATSLGTAILAGVAAGFFGTVEEGVSACVRPAHAFEPDLNLTPLYAERYARFRKLARAARAGAKPTGRAQEPDNQGKP